MWQRFTERARNLVFSAQEEAQKLGHSYVGTEHLLVGMLRDSESVAATILTRLGLDLASIRNEVISLMPDREDNTDFKNMGLTPRGKRTIDLAYNSARDLKHNYIGTEHLLLGLVRDAESLAGSVLAKLGITEERVLRSLREIEAAQVSKDN